MCFDFFKSKARTMSARSNRAHHPNSQGLEGGISLEDAGGVEDLFGCGGDTDADEEDPYDDQDDQDEGVGESEGEDEGGERKKKKTKEKGRAKAKGKSKAKAKRAQVPSDLKNRLGRCMINWCRTNPELVPLRPKQPNCEPCTMDICTMRRDAKKTGKAAVKFLKDMEAEMKKGKTAGLMKLHKAWTEAVGETGSSRIGKFDWASYSERFVVKAGRQEKDSMVPMTHAEYLQHLEKKGLGGVAAKRKLERKLADLSTEHGKDPETELPTIYVELGIEKSKLVERFKEQSVSRGTKEMKNPTQEAVAEMVDNLDLDMPSIGQTSRFDAYTEGKPGMAALVTGSSVCLEEEMWSLEGVEAALKNAGQAAAAMTKEKEEFVDALFDPVADAAEAKNTVRKDHTDMVAATNKCAEDTKQILTQIGPEAESYYEDTLPALKKRHALLLAAISGKEALETAKATEKEASTQSSGAGLDKFKDLKSLAEIDDLMKKIGCGAKTVAEVQESTNMFLQNGIAPMIALVEAIKLTFLWSSGARFPRSPSSN